MKYLVLILISLFILSCNSQTNLKVLENLNSKYGKSIPFMLGLHNEHKNQDSLKIEFIDNSNDSKMIHKGSFSGWGTRWTDKKIRTGEYKLRITWVEGNEIKQTQKKILIKPETDYFSLNIELANDTLWNRTHNAIYLDQYSKSIDSVKFTRLWNPKEQYGQDSMLVPDYEVLNNHDSIIYGAHKRFSLSLSINWIQPHYIAFMNFEVQTDSGWRQMPCSGPRIEMDLNSGEKGKTLKDLTLGCPSNNFEKNKNYRVIICYMFNEIFFEENIAKNNIEDNKYIEQTIYYYSDYFNVR